MRIAVCNTFGRFLGGIESYLGRVIPALAEEGHELALLFEMDAPVAQPPLPIPGRAWFVSQIGGSETLRGLREWRPHIIYTHAMSDAGLEQAIVETAPAVLFAHDYSATCISGTKRFAFPRTSWCSRRLGVECLVNYFPRRCGGISPITMWQNYHSRLARLEVMRGCRRLLVASEAMRQEYLRHGFELSRVEVVPYPAAPVAAGAADDAGTAGNHGLSEVQRSVPSMAVRLLFAGRMVKLKGGEILLRALPSVSQRLQRPLKLTMAGEGPAKVEWEEQARTLCAHNPFISVEFTGWLEHTDLKKLIAACDLLVVPSLWPEPFGMIGPEAGAAGLPAAAFAVGGIPEWLRDGINGFLAPANPPSAAGIAAAIEKCLADPFHYRQLRQGAKREAMKYSLKRHVVRLLDIFSRAAAGTAATRWGKAEPASSHENRSPANESAEYEAVQGACIREV
jgi:glycosyltransferase involved in cell wall biosynthesis